ncbi:MAG: ABC transporter substrate-binding protein [Gemmatimonadetes bacterium]|nr:ABC transporter substrate-binding protein [Gemmatimonadota bacterium]
MARWLLPALAVFGCGVSVEPAGAGTLTDVRGRTVTLPDGAPRIAIDDGRYLLALSLLLEDPTTAIVGWPHDVNRIGDGTYERYVDRFPRLPELGRVSSSATAFSIEQTLAVDPTVAVFSLGRGPTDEQIEQLDRAGVVSVFLDFYMDPLANVDRSLEILGQLVGETARADRFVALRQERRSRIRRALDDDAPERPSVFFEAHAGMSPECCNSPGKGNVGVYIDLVGGHNIGADVLPGPIGRLSLEYVLERDPAVYVATGGPHLVGTGGLVLGTGYGPQAATEALIRAVERPGIEHLDAVGLGRAHGLSHHLLNSPLDIVAIELLARWIHPDRFADVDPAATLDVINRDFLVVELDGTHWVSLPSSDDGSS